MFCELSAAGFDGCELNIDKDGSSAHCLSMNTTEKQLSQIRELSEKYSLPVVSISSSLYGDSLGSPDANRRAFGLELLRKQTFCAKALGADGILVVPGGMSQDVSLLEAWNNSLETLSGIKAEIESNKVFVGVENVWNMFFSSAFDMCRFIDTIGCEYIGAYYDAGNVAAFSASEHWVEILGSRIGKVHVKDFKRNDGVNSGGEWRDVTCGDVNWQKVVPALRKAGFDGYLTAEVFKTDDKMSYTDYYALVASQLEQIIKY